jgi:penicillin V acylase-like amidase (Ntn superfamily)
MRTRAFLSSLLAIALLSPGPAFACSAFVLKGDTYTVLGFNENWRYLPGMVVVNKRGVRKYNLSWSRMVAAQTSKPELSWTSKYGSVTTTVMGLDLPCYGMNERGLFVVELALEKTYSKPDPARPNMFWGQWIQYQLDNYATVQEVVEHVKSGPVIDWWPGWPQFYGSHFFVSDAEGKTAAIELIDGEPVISSGSSMPVPALCNDSYVHEAARLAEYDGFGGTKHFDMQSTDFGERFLKLAYGLKDYKRESDSPIDYAWKMLDGVHPGVWQLVGDVRGRVLYFRTAQVGKIKSIHLDKLDFSAASPILFVDLHLNFQGDITTALSQWTPGVNRAYVTVGFPAAYQDKFYNSPDYIHVVRNLDDYVSGIERQQTKRMAQRWKR